MLQMLRAMNHWELAEVCRTAGVPEGSRPEEIVRALSGAWWAAPWGAAEEERVLLLRAAEALNLMPRLRRHRRRLGLVERMVYGALIQQAFVSAPEEQQSALLTAAAAHLEPAQAALAAPIQTALSPVDRRQVALLRLVGTGAGLRAVTAALGDVPVEPASSGGRPGPAALLNALASAGTEAWSGRVVEWVRARRGPELQPLFQVLRLCWRRRQRMLLELRASAVALADEEKRLSARLESVAADRAAARRRLPWHLRPSTGTGIAIGALAGAAAELVLTGTIQVAAPLAAGTGSLWTLAALASTRRAGDTHPSLPEEIRRARRQRALIERQISQLEE
jgi:hypothetical protein